MNLSNNPLNKCSNCGGKLQYDFRQNKYICEYCGAAFNASTESPSDEDEESDDEVNENYIPFTREAEDVKKRLMLWLADDECVAPEVFLPTQPYSLTKRFVPTIYFKGEYDGTYSLDDKNGNRISGNNPIKGTYDFFTLGMSASEVEQAAIERFAATVNTTNIMPLEAIADDDNVDIEEVDPEDIWEEIGQQKVLRQAYETVKPNPKMNYDQSLEFRHNSVAVVYVPFWVVQELSPLKFEMYLNDTNGEIIGTKPLDYRLIPLPMKFVIKNSIITGLLIWVALWFAQYAYVSNHGHPSPMNNIFVSPIGSTWWFIRGISLLAISVLTGTQLLYPLFRKTQLSRPEKIKSREINSILSGIKPSIFVQA